LFNLVFDESKAAEFHYEVGRLLQPLRDEGILIVGNGNIVHNLRAYVWGDQAVPAFDWALYFEAGVRGLILDGRERELADFSRLGDDARLSVPSPDHFLPLLYLMGLRREGDAVSFPVEGIEGGSLSMLSVRIG